MTREDLDDGCMRTEKLRSSIVWPGHPPVAFLEAPAGVRSQKGDGSAVRVASGPSGSAGPASGPSPTRSTDRR